MKKLTISLLFVYALLHLSRAQTNNAPAAFGSASQIAGVNGDTSISFMIGQAIISNYVAAAQCHLGFPYDAQYMQNTFMGGLWASKGYYPDNVLLQWNIANNADQITGYTISRRLVSTTNTSFQVVATLDPSVMSWHEPVLRNRYFV